MKVLFAGTQPITSPKQEKQNKPASNQNPYSSHPQQNAVFSGTYPQNYKVRFGMPLRNPTPVDIAKANIKSLECGKDYEGLPLSCLWWETNVAQSARMELAKDSPSEHNKLIDTATQRLRELKEHIESGNIPENPAEKETHKPRADYNELEVVAEAKHAYEGISARKYPKGTPDPIGKVDTGIVDYSPNRTKGDLIKVIDNYNEQFEELTKPSAPSGTSSEVTGAPSGSGTQ